MVTDLPDYEKKVVVVTIPGDYPAEIQIDHIKIRGTALKTPTFAQCVPSSIENDALAYDPVTDKFYVWAYGNLDKLQQQATTKELLVQLSHQGVIKDPTQIRALSYSTDSIKAYGSVDALQQRASSKELLVQIQHQGVEKDPTQIRALTVSDIIQAYGSQNQALQQRATTYDLIVQLRHAGVEINPQTIRALVKTSDSIEAALSSYGPVTLADGYTNSVRISSDPSGNPMTQVNYMYYFNGTTWDRVRGTTSGLTVVQAAKDRTISKVDATATAVQISIAGLNGNSSALYTPASGKAIRLKFISIGHSADVDIGYRFGAAGTIYYMRITKGVYVSNLIGCNNQGAADAALYLNSSGATDVKGYCLVEEV